MKEKAIGLDLGEKTLGIAKSDALGFVHGVETFFFKRKEFSLARERVHKLVEETEIKEIALGYPISLKGQENEHTNMCKQFKEDLEKEDPSLKITLVDERLTSVMANNILSELDVSHSTRKNSVDRIAACQILDVYIQRRDNNGIR